MPMHDDELSSECFSRQPAYCTIAPLMLVFSIVVVSPELYLRRRD